jgi:hypothetical protein
LTSSTLPNPPTNNALEHPLVNNQAQKNATIKAIFTAIRIIVLICFPSYRDVVFSLVIASIFVIASKAKQSPEKGMKTVGLLRFARNDELNIKVIEEWSSYNHLHITLQCHNTIFVTKSTCE